MKIGSQTTVYQANLYYIIFAIISKITIVIIVTRLLLQLLFNVATINLNQLDTSHKPPQASDIYLFASHITIKMTQRHKNNKTSETFLSLRYFTRILSDDHKSIYVNTHTDHSTWSDLYMSAFYWMVQRHTDFNDWWDTVLHIDNFSSIIRRFHLHVCTYELHHHLNLQWPIFGNIF